MAVITISRQFGTGAFSVAEFVSEKLGYKLYDRSILNHIAQEMNVSIRWAEYFDKQMGSKFQKILSSKFGKRKIESIVNSNNELLNDKTYIDNIVKAINMFAKEGNAVIVGRAGQFILSNRDNVYHILLVSKKEDRIKFLAETHEATYEWATRTVKDEDSRRQNIYRIFGHENYDDPINYNMVINMSKVKLKTACKLICSLIDVD